MMITDVAFSHAGDRLGTSVSKIGCCGRCNHLNVIMLLVLFSCQALRGSGAGSVEMKSVAKRNAGLLASQELLTSSNCQ